MNKNYNNIYTTKPRITDNFYAHVNHDWLINNNVPDDEIKYTSFIKTQKRINKQLNELLENNSYPLATKLYRSYLNQEYRNRECLNELREFVKIVNNVKSVNDLIKMATRLIFVNVNTIFSLAVDSSIYSNDDNILYIGQTTLGLLEVSYYQNSKYNYIRQKYYDSICLIYQEMYPNLSIDNVNNIAKTIIDIETKLSNISLNNTDKRDDITSLVKLDKLIDKYPKLHFNSLVDVLCVLSNNTVNKSNFETVILENSSKNDYFSQLEILLESYPISSWIEYFRFRIILRYMNLTNYKMTNIHFDLFNKTIKGQKVPKDIINYATLFTCKLLNDPMSRLYVKYYGDENKNNYIIEMVKNIKKVTYNRISNLEWMTNNTKKEALKKLCNMKLKVGYSKAKPRNYDHIILNNSLVNNFLVISIDNTIFHLNKLNHKIDVNEWNLPSYIVNAYYNPSRNEIIFPAAILNEPFLDLQKDHIYNYSHIGSIVGHEIIHGFDDNGSQYDAYGNVRDWWTSQDRENYNRKVEQIIEMYDNLGVNGKLTAGENIADFGAVVMPLYGLIEKLKHENIKINIDIIKKFYIEYCKHWRYLIRDEYVDHKLLNDPHSFAFMRVNIPLQNQKLFQKVFNVKPNDKMYIDPNKYLNIW